MSLGDELVTNGTFNTDISGWTVTPDFSWVWLEEDPNYAATNDSTEGTLSQQLAVTPGKTYQVQFEIVEIYEPLTVTFAGEAVDVVESADTYSYEVICGAGDTIAFTHDTTNYLAIILDNVSVKEIISAAGGTIAPDLIYQLYEDE